MTNHDDTAGLPLLHLDNIPLPVRADDPVRAALKALQSRLMDLGEFGDADLVGWLLDDLDRLPAPWGRVVRLLVTGSGVEAEKAHLDV